ncbi:hypothetical protein [Paenibacillus ginsengihumi]|uniref:hypothetical protein n=1 Tax=Paenibacillus ginsengihumi TaxID=431596 RepID=UPI000369F587|nr:hypothetical protein [Paenibacillus ginsengihumi]
MVDVDKLAGIFASGFCQIERVYRLVIQPHSLLRDFRTARHGLLVPVRGKARMRVDGTVYDMHPGAVLHAAPGMQLDSQVLDPPGGRAVYGISRTIIRSNARPASWRRAGVKVSLESLPELKGDEWICDKAPIRRFLNVRHGYSDLKKIGRNPPANFQAPQVMTDDEGIACYRRPT